MADQLPPEQQASYSAIIDDILASSDLNTVSAKRIRKGLQEKIDYDITPQKEAITELIMNRFDKLQQKHEAEAGAAGNGTTAAAVLEPAPTTNGAVDHSPSSSPAKRKAASVSDDEDVDMSDLASSPPPQKKPKKSKAASTEETDEQLAKRLAAELNAPHARSTRGGGATRKKAVVKKAGTTPSKKKKSKAKVGSDEDSNISDSAADKPVKERKGGFHKPMVLSPPLAAMLGEAQLSRPQTVKKIWAYVKERDLQDPSDKRQIRCDDAMRAVFKQERVHMFTMNKLLATHLYAVDE